MSVYLDANVLVALFFPDDPFGTRAYALVRASLPAVMVSDFAAAEFASVINREVRMGRISIGVAREAFSDFDAWVGAAQRPQVTPEDVGTAESFLRRLNLNLRTPDALHLAMAQRLRAQFGTFDRTLSVCARALRIPLVN